MYGFSGPMTEMHMNLLSLLAVQIIGLYSANFRLLITPLGTSQERVGIWWLREYGGDIENIHEKIQGWPHLH